ncbi:uncharacterized protein BDZ99DRAFT_518160 [Mytilinidion resinicola]|uniref:DUF1330 domain-containing protein n=1 Tax=Mytilinidion resinicola TaxID=574789 RepID=A0A6A6YWD4_9PEZI|nr:uncharacterized protein BDZ99DRAFT_518160 [Mytilinidion resinicola]KAF2812304.1 hypothetical protein BDZ99DRAFT_518160 [Mytilinidion resinicola]
MLPHTSIAESALTSLSAAHPPTAPIFMLNLLRYRPTAAYTAPTDLPQVSGHEAYHARYVPALRPLMAANGSVPIFLGRVYAALCGPAEGERWDEVAIVMYPSVAAFKEMVGSETYKKECEMHRRAALEEWRLVPCERVEL